VGVGPALLGRPSFFAITCHGRRMIMRHLSAEDRLAIIWINSSTRRVVMGNAAIASASLSRALTRLKDIPIRLPSGGAPMSPDLPRVQDMADAGLTIPPTGGRLPMPCWFDPSIAASEGGSAPSVCVPRRALSYFVIRVLCGSGHHSVAPPPVSSSLHTPVWGTLAQSTQIRRDVLPKRDSTACSASSARKQLGSIYRCVPIS
jgi:hypothetical protein